MTLGDVYLAESHTDVADSNLIGRISVFDRNGKFLRATGRTGTAPGEFRTPYALEFDSRGRTSRRGSPQSSHPDPDQGGAFVVAYDDFGRISELAIDATTSSTPPIRSRAPGCIQAGSGASASVA